MPCDDVMSLTDGTIDEKMRENGKRGRNLNDEGVKYVGGRTVC